MFMSMVHLLRRGPSTCNAVQLFLYRSFCSVEVEGDSWKQQLTLSNLGFREDGYDSFEFPSASSRNRQQSRPSRQKRDSSALVPPPAPTPSPEEMKQAALDASQLLAGIAGMQLTRPKKLEEVSKAASQTVTEQEEEDDDGAEEVKEEEDDEEEEEEQESIGAKQQEIKTSCEHPWQIWVDFLKDIHAKGCFEGTEGVIEEGKSLFECYSAVRHAICAFGRERTDICRLLKRSDLRVLANYGCPDLERKASNASKRLRAQFGIPEGEVCQRCSVKMSCPRAFLAPAAKMPIKTLDVLRIITGFASNAWPSAESFTSYPEELETSVCNLLSEILTFSSFPKEVTSDEEGPSPEPGPSKKKISFSHMVDKKPGDWACPNCKFMNFNRNRRCRECKVFRPPQEQKILYGDWACSKCSYVNFSRNRYCRECSAKRPMEAQGEGERLPDGDPIDKLQCKSVSGWESRDTETAQRVKSVGDAKSRRNLKMKKRGEKVYEASEDEGLSEAALVNHAGENTQSDVDLSDEEDRALSRVSSTVASGKVQKALFRWSDDEDVEERRSRCPKKGRKTLMSRASKTVRGGKSSRK